MSFINDFFLCLFPNYNVVQLQGSSGGPNYTTKCRSIRSARYRDRVRVSVQFRGCPPWSRGPRARRQPATEMDTLQSTHSTHGVCHFPSLVGGRNGRDYSCTASIPDTDADTKPEQYQARGGRRGPKGIAVTVCSQS